MSSFPYAVRDFMIGPVHTRGERESLVDAYEALERYTVSALPVVGERGKLVGVVSRTDLLKAGRMRPVPGTRRRRLTLPDAQVRQHMSATVEVVGPDTPLVEVATRMVRQHISPGLRRHRSAAARCYFHQRYGCGRLPKRV